MISAKLNSSAVSFPAVENKLVGFRYNGSYMCHSCAHDASAGEVSKHDAHAYEYVRKLSSGRLSNDGAAKLLSFARYLMLACHD